jgi:hypothetical protein
MLELFLIKNSQQLQRGIYSNQQARTPWGFPFTRCRYHSTTSSHRISRICLLALYQSLLRSSKSCRLLPGLGVTWTRWASWSRRSWPYRCLQLTATFNVRLFLFAPKYIAPAASSPFWGLSLGLALALPNCALLYCRHCLALTLSMTALWC